MTIGTGLWRSSEVRYSWEGHYCGTVLAPTILRTITVWHGLCDQAVGHQLEYVATLNDHNAPCNWTHLIIDGIYQRTAPLSKQLALDSKATDSEFTTTAPEGESWVPDKQFELISSCRELGICSPR